ncbi:restriction endonuclease subunit S [Thiobacillus sp. 65-1402]|uniref:restriction endonuclease subunit S n=1 Tax=Thiobacillus sp. 65-1402 TaxID=1895861 RepID=UPI0025D3DE27|nr:restriction endonuclease subunit S [Thiobacillus sp. 65-1402]
MSANNVKFSGLDKLDSINYVDEELYKKWMKEEIRRGDLLLTSEAPSGQVMLWDSDEKIVLSQRLYALRPASNVDNKYLKYYLQCPIGQKEIFRNNSGSTVAGISAKTFSNILVRHPTKSCQKAIGDLLYLLDKKIDCNNRINAELESMAKTLYDYWFVQFDFPDANGKPYQSSGGKMVYNATLKREIPAGWRHSTIGETFKTHLGGTPSREQVEYWTPGEVNWLSSGENPSLFVVDPDERISKLGLQNSPAKLLPQGTVILSIVRHLRASILGIEAATNQSVVGILETGKLKHSLIYPYLVREIPRLMALRTGAQQPHINKGVLDESLLVLPDESTLEAYTNLAAPLFLQIKNHHQQNRELTQLRDWLLPLLMNGQVTVA